MSVLPRRIMSMYLPEMNIRFSCVWKSPSFTMVKSTCVLVFSSICWKNQRLLKSVDWFSSVYWKAVRLTLSSATAEPTSVSVRASARRTETIFFIEKISFLLCHSHAGNGTVLIHHAAADV